MKPVLSLLIAFVIPSAAVAQDRDVARELRKLRAEIQQLRKDVAALKAQLGHRGVQYATTLKAYRGGDGKKGHVEMWIQGPGDKKLRKVSPEEFRKYGGTYRLWTDQDSNPKKFRGRIERWRQDFDPEKMRKRAEQFRDRARKFRDRDDDRKPRRFRNRDRDDDDRPKRRSRRGERDERFEFRFDIDPDDMKELRKWLKSRHGLGRTTCMVIADATLGDPDKKPPSASELIAAQYRGDRAALRPAYDRLLREVKRLGRDVSIGVRKTQTTVSRGACFAILKAPQRHVSTSACVYPLSILVSAWKPPKPSVTTRPTACVSARPKKSTGSCAAG